MTDWADAGELRERLDRGDVGPGEVLDAARRRLEKANPALNAVIHVEEDPRGSGRGPLADIPVLVKDLGCAQAGRPHHHGARFLRDLAWTAPRDSWMWTRLAGAGVVCLGRTNTPEFGTTIATEPAAYGPTANPWDLARSPGGSSGGSAAAVAAGIVPIAHGNDGGGSIRIPASACGLVGLKPTRGRVSVGPDAGEHRGGFAVDGVLTRTVRDTALALDVLAVPAPGDPYAAAPMGPPPPGRLRIGRSVADADPAVAAVVDVAARFLGDLGHVVDDAEPDGWYDAELTDRTVVVRTVAMARELDSWTDRIGRPVVEDDVEAANWWSAELGRTLPATMYQDAREWMAAWSRRVAAFWSDHDLLLTPVLGASPPEIGFLSDPLEGQARLRELLGFVDQANVSGQPAISLPVGTTDGGLPVGVQLVADHGGEALLLEVAARLEECVGWDRRHPPEPT